MKTGKRILKVTVRRMVDEDPDTSYLGEYSNQRRSEYSIDRKHTLDCIANRPMKIQPHTIYECGICDSYHPWEWDGDCRDDDNRYQSPEQYAESEGVLVEKVAVLDMDDRTHADEGCNCGESGDWRLGEYQYFNPSFNYVDKQGRALPENTPEEVRRYVAEDYARMEDYNWQGWCYIGIRAEAKLQLQKDGPIQRLTSGGLWGIESDSGDDYIAQVEREELADLKQTLLAVGFSRRAIAIAFKAVEQKYE